MSTKRRRTDGGSVANGRAIAAAIAVRKRFPYATYGATYHQRGTPDNVGRFGADFRSATADQRASRKQYGYYGRGSYFSDALGELKGAGMSYLRGGQAGLASHVGDRILHSKPLKRIGRYFGMGAYSTGGAHGPGVVYNQLVNPGSHPYQNHSAVMHSSPGEEGVITIENKEFIQDINSPALTTTFATLFSSAVNPGLQQCFPWLSQIAQFYDEYEFEQLVFEFRSLVTEGNSTAGGSVIMAAQYNVLNSLFISKQTMENYDYAVSGKVTECQTLGVECHPDKRNFEQLFVRTGSVPTNADQKTYDHALFQLSVAGSPAGVVGLGELWVHYRLKLKKTKLLGGFLASLSGPASNSALFFQLKANSLSNDNIALLALVVPATGTTQLYANLTQMQSTTYAVANQCYDNTGGCSLVNTQNNTNQEMAFSFPATCNPFGLMFFEVLVMTNMPQNSTPQAQNQIQYSNGNVNCTAQNSVQSTSLQNVADTTNLSRCVYQTTASGAFTFKMTSMSLTSASLPGGTRSWVLSVKQLPYNHVVTSFG